MTLREQKNILLIEDDLDQAVLLGRWFNGKPGWSVSITSNAENALDILETKKIDLLLTDIELPGINGVELAKRAKSLQPDLRIILVTAHGQLDYAMKAIRCQVDDFLLKPLMRKTFMAQVEALLEKPKEVSQKKRKTVLAIGAHPDDVEIGCGGILLRHVSDGNRVVVLTLSAGAAGGEKAIRSTEAKSAAKTMGVELRIANLADTSISPGNGTIELIASLIEEIKPDIVYTHSLHDTHQDHRSVFQATLVAARSVDSLFCYQSPSATTTFDPNTYVDIGRFIKQKLNVISSYKSQTEKCDYLEPELIRATSKYWGRYAGHRLVEPLEVIRSTNIDEVEEKVLMLA